MLLAVIYFTFKCSCFVVQSARSLLLSVPNVREFLCQNYGTHSFVLLCIYALSLFCSGISTFWELINPDSMSFTVLVGLEIESYYIRIFQNNYLF